MAKDIVMQKSANGALMPMDQVGLEYLQSLPVGRAFGVTLTQARNYEFHKKIFALLGYLYDALPRVTGEINGQPAEQSFETFRHEFVAISGHYKTVITRTGTRIESQSLSYKDCSEELAQQIFSDVINKGLEKLGEVGKGMTESELQHIVNELLRFDG